MPHNRTFQTTLLCLTLAFFACAKGTLDPIDQKIGFTRKDFDKTLVRDIKKDLKNKKSAQKDGDPTEAPIPTISKLVVAPPPPSSVTSKTISFSVTDQVPLKDVLIELGRVAKIDVDLDPTISGGVVINARNRPLGEVIDRIATLGKLRYGYENGILHFERDAPYTKNYAVDYLSENSNLWGEVQSNISLILSNNMTAAGASSNQNTLNNAATTPTTTTGTANNGTTTPSTGANTSTTNQTTTSALLKGSVSVNKTAGIMSVFATQADHKEIEKYLAKVEETASAQVLIEAKIVEVKLSDTYKTGINWGFKDHNNSGTLKNGYTSGSSGIDASIGFIFAKNLNASVSALETFGTTRTLSSPRIHAINNQKATLNFTDKLIYFKIDNSQTTTSTTAAVIANTLTSTKQEENVGIELNIVPSINVKTQEITLSIKPKITLHTDDVIDPASPKDPTTGKITAENKVPVIQTREISTIAKIQSGSVVVIGGLMKEDSTNTDSGIPFLQRIPVLGNLFKSTNKSSSVIETVIFIKATIVKSNSTVDKIDRDIQEKFDTNRRKFF